MIYININRENIYQSKQGGNLDSTGCVSFMFQSKGQIIIERQDGMDQDEIMMQALDAGAEDFDAQEEVFEITTTPEDFGTVREALEGAGLEFLPAEVTMIPDTTAPVDMEIAAKVQKLIDKLEDDDYVQDFYRYN